MARRPRSFSEAVSNFFANWDTYEASLLEKSRLTIRNNVRKVRTRRDCCGNLGEPGC